MRTKLIATALAAVMSLGAVPAFAQDIIAPETVIQNSSIGDLNSLTTIISHNIGSDTDSTGTVIQPVTVIDGLDTNLLNLITTIVNINCHVDLSDINGMIESMRGDIIDSMSR